MRNNNIKNVICLMLVIVFLMSANTFALKITKSSVLNEGETVVKSIVNNEIPISYVQQDLDPLVDLEVTVAIKEIRAFDEIENIGEHDFYVKIYINEEEFTSPTWFNTKYVKDQDWSVKLNVPDDVEDVSIKIQLWERNVGFDRLCDISKDYTLFKESRDVELIYNIRTGHWYGDDAIQHYLDWDARGDPSGYGRLNGCDDNSIYKQDMDCELWFDITQNDYDGDGIPYWTEVNIYGTDPEVCDLGRDDDNDGVPIEWEFKWGFYAGYNQHNKKWIQGWIYDPFVWEDHSSFDFDEDGLDNVEEYKAFKEGFRTDPFRKDILLEIDQMKIGPDGQGAELPDLTKDLLWDAYGKHNIVFQIDDQGQTIPFDLNTSGWHGPELQDIYFNYFLNGNESYWRRGAFHYAPIIYRADDHPGFMWPSIVGDWDGTWNFSENNNQNVSIYGDCFQVSTRQHEKVQYLYPLFYKLAHKTCNREQQRAIIYATAIMHETGHVLGIFHDNTPGCDNYTGKHPWQKDWWIWRNYKSVMNYGWMYQFVDYSDGSHGKNDFDDWSNIDLTLFQIERNPYYKG